MTRLQGWGGRRQEIDRSGWCAVAGGWCVVGVNKGADGDEVAVCRFGCVCKARSGVGVEA